MFRWSVLMTGRLPLIKAKLLSKGIQGIASSPNIINTLGAMWQALYHFHLVQQLPIYWRQWALLVMHALDRCYYQCFTRMHSGASPFPDFVSGMQNVIQHCSINGCFPLYVMQSSLTWIILLFTVSAPIEEHTTAKCPMQHCCNK